MLQSKQLKKCSRPACDNPKTDQNGFLTTDNFTKDRTNLDGLCGYCSSCKKKDNLKSVLKYTVKGKEIKLTGIKKQNCICPGCGFDFSICPDKALLIVFELSHVHSANCKQRKRKGSNNYFFSVIDEYFWSCLPCNRKQKAVCGYWENPTVFKRTCV